MHGAIILWIAHEKFRCREISKFFVQLNPPLSFNENQRFSSMTTSRNNKKLSYAQKNIKDLVGMKNFNVKNKMPLNHQTSSMTTSRNNKKLSYARIKTRFSWHEKFQCKE